MGQNVCDKMLWVCSPIIGEPQGVRSIAYFPEFILTFEVFYVFQKWSFRSFVSICKNRISPQNETTSPRADKGRQMDKSLRKEGQAV